MKSKMLYELIKSRYKDRLRLCLRVHSSNQGVHSLCLGVQFSMSRCTELHFFSNLGFFLRQPNEHAIKLELKTIFLRQSNGHVTSGNFQSGTKLAVLGV